MNAKIRLCFSTDPYVYMLLGKLVKQLGVNEKLLK